MCSMKKVQATWKKFNIKKMQHRNSRGAARPRELETIFNGFVNYCCKALHLRCLWGSWLHLWKQCNMNKVQQEKIATCEERYRRRMWKENIATCKSAT